jgi:Fe-S-cluster containining protein
MNGEGPSSAADDPGAGRPKAELRALYDQLDAEIAQLGPVCQLSGRCCRFGEHGHTLFVSALEIDLLVEQAPGPSRPLDGGETCPWQDSLGRCEARGARPLGCRIYYCDPAYQDAASELSERFIGRLKQLVDRHGLSWDYASLHRHLHEQRDRGRLAIDLAPANPA